MSLTEQLKELASLLEQGLITQEQFERQREQVLAMGRGGTQSNPQISEAIGAYRLMGEVGRGGMGVVYRARHRSETIAQRQGGDVALKVLHSQYASNATFQARFEREASVGLRLAHPGIVKVHDLVVEGQTLGLAMEFVEGKNLSEVIGLERGPIPWQEAIGLFKGIVEAIRYGHEQGVIHRDLKPENIILTQSGNLKVLDFGIAKESGSNKTKTGTGMGTVDYMAPEQYLNAKAIDHRADIYALGMTLYEMLAGCLPWRVETSEFEILDLKRKGELRPPTHFYPDIPPWLVAVVMQAISVDLDTRIADCDTFLKRLDEPAVQAGEHLSKQETVSSVPTTAPAEPQPTEPPVQVEKKTRKPNSKIVNDNNIWAAIVVSLFVPVVMTLFICVVMFFVVVSVL